MDNFLKAYSIKEASESTGIAQGTIRQWEKDFSEVLTIPRSESNARYFTEFEIETLKHIKTMRDKNISIDMIRDLLKKHSNTSSNAISLPEFSVPTMKQSEVTEILRDIQNTFEKIPEIKKAFASEVRKDLKRELSEIVRKEINDAMNVKNNDLLLQLKKEKEIDTRSLWQRIRNK